MSTPNPTAIDLRVELAAAAMYERQGTSWTRAFGPKRWPDCKPTMRTRLLLDVSESGWVGTMLPTTNDEWNRVSSWLMALGGSIGAYALCDTGWTLPGGIVAMVTGLWVAHLVR